MPIRWSLSANSKKGLLVVAELCHTTRAEERFLYDQVVLHAEVGLFVLKHDIGELAEVGDLQSGCGKLMRLPVFFTRFEGFDRLNILVRQMAAAEVGNDAG